VKEETRNLNGQRQGSSPEVPSCLGTVEHANGGVTQSGRVIDGSAFLNLLSESEKCNRLNCRIISLLPAVMNVD